MFGRRHIPRNCNFVHEDEIWKAHVDRERETAKNWPRQWGFMLPPIIKEKPNDHDKRALSVNNNTSNCVKLPPINTVVKIPTTRRNTRSKKRKATQEPLTTTGLIGWRTANDNVLEKYGRHARGIGKVDVPVSILHRL